MIETVTVNIGLFEVMYICLTLFACYFIFLTFLKNGKIEPMKIDDVDIHANGVIFPVSYWTEQGCRPYQEDRYEFFSNRSKIFRSDSKKMAEPAASLYGLFDGHGGDAAAEHCKKYMLSEILNNEAFIEDQEKGMKDAMSRYETICSISFMN
jgi:hypothetical protein